jgi:hypothetical protein
MPTSADRTTPLVKFRGILTSHEAAYCATPRGDRGTVVDAIMEELSRSAAERELVISEGEELQQVSMAMLPPAQVS